MIQCPECGKEIADNSAHCGFCGAEIETGSGKKTMIGFAAVTDDAMREAAEEARRARESAEQQANQGSGGPTDQGGGPSSPAGGEKKLKLPTPSGASEPPSDSPQSSGGGPPKFSVPKPGSPGGSDDAAVHEAKTEAMSAIPTTTPDDTIPTDSPDIDSMADTDPGEMDGFDEEPPRRPIPSETPGANQKTPMLGEKLENAQQAEPSTSSGAPPTLDERDAFTPAGDTPADDDEWSTIGDEATAPEADAPGTGPTEFGGGAGPSEFGGAPAEASGPGQFGTGTDLAAAQNTLPEKEDKNPIVIAVIAFAVLMTLCCIVGLIASFFL